VTDAPRAPADRSSPTRSADPSSSPVRREQDTSWSASPVRDPGRYEFLNEHGRGGLGRVSRVHDKDFGRNIAIKELLARSPVNEVRFVREAMITARLEHPGIVPVYESGRWPDGTPFYAMKLVSGRSLRALIAERKTVDERIGLLHHVIAVADAIAYAHGRSIIHRDLKPANVIVGDFGETVVIDWGLAKDLSDSADLPRGDGSPAPGDGLTSAGAILGTPTYMAPEQARGEVVDQRADVFAIGAMLWELCAVQKVPPTDLAHRHRMLRRAGIDADLVTIIDKALDPDPERRYLDAGELAADLKAFKSGARIAAREYSLWAMLAHWTRRHRALALSVTVVVSLAAASALVYVRNIAVARDRADIALVRAQVERDRSKLSEAALVIDRDPNRARDLLSSFTTRAPQVALLTSRARQLSATHVIPLSTTVYGLFRASGKESVEMRTSGDALVRIDPRTGALTNVDDGVTEAFTYRDGQPVYGRRQPGAGGVEIVTPSNRSAFPFGDLESATHIVALDSATYVLDARGDLHRFDGAVSAVVDHGIHGIVGDRDLLLVCRRNGQLDVERGGSVVRRERCAQTKSPLAMAVIGHDYVAVTDRGSLIVSRSDVALELPAGLTGEYELALSSRGVVGISDYVAGGKSWFVRPGGTQLEPGPVYPSQPYGVAADGDLVAWSYEDGTVIVRDTLTGLVWGLHGHPGSVGFLVIDAANARVISASRRELRIWEIKRAPTSLVAAMPCSIFHVELSPDGSTGALDCNDGGVRIWSRRTGAVTQIQKHVGYSDGVRWFGERLCSAAQGDGQVQCSNPDGSALEILESHSRSADSLTVAADQHAIAFSSRAGKVWRFDRTRHTLRTLYAHQGRRVVTAISDDSRLLASCAEDGSLTVYDLRTDRFVAQIFAHAGEPCGVSWVGDELWSSGGEGTLKRWALRDGELRLQHAVQATAALRLLKPIGSGWTAVEGASTLLISRDGTSVALRIDAGKSVTALDVSADRHYIAASANGEIIVIDLQRNAIATLATGAPIQQLGFLEPALLSFSEPAALKTLRVDQLDYVPFVPTPAPPNRVSF
jgi:eukaryotic-like serine/threonine-protein kinase